MYMKAGKVYFALSSVLIIVVMILVIATNAVPTPAYANAHPAITDSASMVSAKEDVFEDESIADRMIALGTSLIGTRYTHAGRSKATGFDCSGFTHYIFSQFGINLSPASKEQIFAGQQVELSQVRKGDLLVFTGTNMAIRKPGHVGIVITKQGERPVKFVHSSSNGGVKISQVDDTRYALRLMQVRRLLN